MKEEAASKVMAANPIDFYFDFSSPYGYLAARVIDGLGREFGREVIWYPILLGVVMKMTGAQPLLELPLKGEYARRDLARSARRLGIPFAVPPQFPFPSIAACRAFYWLEREDPRTAKAFALRLYERAFRDGKDIAKPEGVLESAGEAGLDTQAMAAALQDPEIKNLLRQRVEEAVEKGVFGSPFFIVDGEPFWGHDRLRDMREWLRRGGW